MQSSRKIPLWAAALGIFTACQGQPPAAPLAIPVVAPARPAEASAAAWQIVAISRGDDGPSGRPAGGALADFVLDLDGPPGFARVTLKTEPTVATAGPAPAYLNDVLFPISGPTHLVATLGADPDQARIVVTSNGAESTVSIQARTPGPLAQEVRSEVLTHPGATIPAGREVAVGQWFTLDERGTCTQTVQILLTRQPTGPRLKPERPTPAGPTFSPE